MGDFVLLVRFDSEEKERGERAVAGCGEVVGAQVLLSCSRA